MVGLPTSKEKCSGCGACVNICPKKALSLTDGISFFEYPQVKPELCIDCGLCINTCHANKVIESNYPTKSFAVISIDKDDRDSSATGGASSVLVNTVLEQNGVVYGCEEIDYKNIVHSRIDKISKSYRIKGSKYAQSFLGNTFSQIKDDLVKGTLVLFTGTPCQIAGLKSFLHRDYSNLILVEIICFGNVASHFLADHVDYLCKENSIDNNNLQVYFRMKGETTADLKYGSFFYKQGKLVKAFYSPDDGYHFGFRQGYYLRENCFQCRYAKHERCSDITIGDFWGLGNDSSMRKYRNVSVLLINTEKGGKLFEESKSKFIIEERPLKEALNNPHFKGAALKPNGWAEIRNDYHVHGYEYMFNKHIKPAIRTYKRKRLLNRTIGYAICIKNKIFK